MKIHTDWMVR